MAKHVEGERITKKETFMQSVITLIFSQLLIKVLG